MAWWTGPCRAAASACGEEGAWRGRQWAGVGKGGKEGAEGRAPEGAGATPAAVGEGPNQRVVGQVSVGVCLGPQVSHRLCAGRRGLALDLVA